MDNYISPNISDDERSNNENIDAVTAVSKAREQVYYLFNSKI